MASLRRVQYPFWTDYKRGPTPYGNEPQSLKDYQKRCDPDICRVIYPIKNCWSGMNLSLPCKPFGYQPKRENPGDKIFYQYQYPFQTQFGKPYSNKGTGWAYYEQTGRMPGSQYDY
uniref:Uncharacterized protein n=1 Tax=Marseillevirus LCMAC101 TaxID=2506602 RepID=A0A481YSJ4_9VIRU|nr:MAG: hypothetical protein LCMAC101_06240 [Marseillevirus LCMAC101]